MSSERVETSLSLSVALKLLPTLAIIQLTTSSMTPSGRCYHRPVSLMLCYQLDLSGVLASESMALNCLMSSYKTLQTTVQVDIECTAKPGLARSRCIYDDIIPICLSCVAESFACQVLLDGKYL